MVTLKGIEMKIGNSLLCMFYIILLAGCSMVHEKQSIDDIKNLTKIDVRDYLFFEREYNQWTNFNGNGCRIIIYNIKKDSFNQIKNKFLEDKFISFDGNSAEFKNDSLLIGRRGIYKNYEISKDEDHIIYLDGKNYQLLWYNIIH